MRTLVEQTRDSVREGLKNSGDLEWNNVGSHNGKVGVHILMGGEEREGNPWDLYPEENTILIGTQDMLLSRALNRGYGMSRYRWPMHFGLLNNDCLWVMDETQLMGVGVETSAQLDGFRHNGKMPTFGASPTWWMSATLDEARFTTVDHPAPDGGWPRESLSDAKRASGRPKELFEAKKSVAPCPVTLSAATNPAYAKQLAELVAKRHQPDTLTLVVVNRVSRAQEIFEALTDKKKPLHDKEHVALVHSRFRRADRKQHERLLFGEGDRIVIATQAVEAGVDVSARLLITELAPWSSLVHRIGRCNRRAEPSGGEVLWVDIEPDVKGDLLLPYSKDELTQAQNTTGITKNQFCTMLDKTLPRDAGAPFDVGLTVACVHLLLFVHRVTGLEPGLYFLLRAERDLPALQQKCHRHFLWRPADEALPLYLLQAGDFQSTATSVSCHQSIAGDGAFSLGMIARFREEVGTAPDRYRHLFWETGMIGQVLYLEAEAQGVRATGIGCFFDDPVHELMGLPDDAFQSLYHFTVGGPREDARLVTRAAYHHLEAPAR
jgi:nitroreductase